jgi:hypothetical protein
MKVKNFAGFMKSRVNESDGATMGNYIGSEGEFASQFGDINQYDGETEDWGANPEEEEEESTDADTDTPEGEETEPVTLDSLKAMIEDLTERVEKLEGGGEDATEGEEEAPEGEEEAPEGEETPEEKPAK